MGRMEETLRSEIRRLAKKEIRVACQPLAKRVRELKRRVAQLTKTVAALEKRRGVSAAAQAAPKLEAPAEEVAGARFSAGLIQKLRKRLGLTQSEFAQVLGVSSTTVAFWEQGRNRPTDSSKAALVALRKLGRRDVRRLLEAATTARAT